MNRQQIETRTILIALTGSRGYGLATEKSDYDYRGIFVATKPYYLGLKKIEQKDKGWTEEPGDFNYLSQDTCIYELRKFLALSIENNPNILELLWFKDYVHLTEVGRVLQQHKQMFLSKKVKQSYAGYGYAQIKRLESHRRWLLEPPKEKPKPEDFGVEVAQLLTIVQINSFLEYLYRLIKDRIQFLEEAEELYHLLTAEIDFKAVLKQYPLQEDTLEYTRIITNTSHNFIQLLQKSQQYYSACREYENYRQWQQNRNPARAAMEAKVGYDAKFAMQAIRLLKTGIEILETQNIIIDRREAGDAEELLAIKNGEYSYDQVMAIANSLYNQLDVSYQKSTLPKNVDREAVNQLCIDLVMMQKWE